MANSLISMIKGDSTLINNTGVLDGQILFNTDEKTISLDDGGVRANYGNSADNINKNLAYIENGNTATRGYSAGAFIIWKGQLYRALVQINSGTAFSVGTNIVADTAGAELSQINADTPWYGTSSTAASTTAKIATTADSKFVLVTGAKVQIKFTYTNTASAPTLNVDSKGAKSIKAYGTTTPTMWWKAGDVVDFTYDGTNWIMGGTQGQIEQIKSDKQDKTDNSLTTTSKTVVGAINEVNSGLGNKQDKSDNTLTTTSKTIVGAINEINSETGGVHYRESVATADSLSQSYQQRFNEIKFPEDCIVLLFLHITYNGQDTYNFQIIDYDGGGQALIYDICTTPRNGYNTHNIVYSFIATANHRYLGMVKREGSNGALATDGTATKLFAYGFVHHT